jgi:hypothetical protein
MYQPMTCQPNSCLTGPTPVSRGARPTPAGAGSRRGGRRRRRPR